MLKSFVYIRKLEKKSEMICLGVMEFDVWWSFSWAQMRAGNWDSYWEMDQNFK